MRVLAGAFLLMAFSPLCVADGLHALDDSDLAGETAQSGIAMDLILQVNADTSGNPLVSMGSCTGLNNGCRMAFQFHNRSSGGGEWVVWKDFFGVLKMNNVWLDAAQSSSSASPYPDTVAANRFMSSGGTPTCLPDSSKTAATCNNILIIFLP